MAERLRCVCACVRAVPVRLSKLANQIAELGAPADGFFLVGDSPVLILREAGMYSDNNLMSGLVNKLVAIASSDQEPLTSLRELVEQAPRVALGDPALAPVGIFTREAFESVDLWDDVSKDAIFALDTRAATAAVQTGNADSNQKELEFNESER